mmetsp:Transcript_2703/g.7935  ORF Transcript_2703/g.7935 Transcript_2703/m.7935 type:complete len:344 (-) Transcript_2703:620-1651(-)
MQRARHATLARRSCRSWRQVPRSRWRTEQAMCAVSRDEHPSRPRAWSAGQPRSAVTTPLHPESVRARRLGESKRRCSRASHSSRLSSWSSGQLAANPVTESSVSEQHRLRSRLVSTGQRRARVCMVKKPARESAAMLSLFSSTHLRWPRDSGMSSAETDAWSTTLCSASQPSKSTDERQGHRAASVARRRQPDSLRDVSTGLLTSRPLRDSQPCRSRDRRCGEVMGTCARSARSGHLAMLSDVSWVATVAASRSTSAVRQTQPDASSVCSSRQRTSTSFTAKSVTLRQSARQMERRRGEPVTMGSSTASLSCEFDTSRASRDGHRSSVAAMRMPQRRRRRKLP